MKPRVQCVLTQWKPGSSSSGSRPILMINAIVTGVLPCPRAVPGSDPPEPEPQSQFFIRVLPHVSKHRPFPGSPGSPGRLHRPELHC
jgi:hypothetical protein